MVLGPVMETSLRQSLLISRGSFGIFVTRPICAALMGFTLLFMLWPMIWKRKTAGKDRSASAQKNSSS
jgi:putative tricarboxylic transport membrane protein